MTSEILHTQQSGRVLTVHIDHPPRNLLGSAMIAALDGLARRLERDGSVGAVVLTGAPHDVFVTHADTPEMLWSTRALRFAPTYGQALAAARVLRTLRRLPRLDAALSRSRLAGLVSLQRADETFLRFNRLDKVIIAAINGLALGGGLILALACDLRLIAETDLPVGLVESNLGLIAAAGGTQRLTRIVGAGRALELLLEGRLLLPAEACELGLVHRVVPPDQLLATAQETAARLARRSPQVVRELKRAVYDAGSRRLTSGIRMEQASMAATITTDESLRMLEAYHGELGAWDSVGNARLLEAWSRLREGRLAA